MKAPVRGCKTCRFADWPNGRRKAGKCTYSIAEVLLPDSVTQYHSFNATMPRTSVWLDMGLTCPTWEKSE